MERSSETPHEPRFRFDGPELESLLREWRGVGRECLDDVERFIRDHPAEAVTLAFLAGAIAGALLGRRA